MKRILITANGLVLPVSDMYKGTGESTQSRDEAVSIVAQLPNGRWIATDEFYQDQLQALH